MRHAMHNKQKKIKEYQAIYKTREGIKENQIHL